MFLEQISIGSRVEISLEKNGETVKTYTSLVEDIYGNNKVLIYMPISYGKLVKLPVNEIYTFVFITDKRMFKYNGKITKYININKFNFMIIELLSEGEKIQRREFFRFNCMLPLKFQKLEQEETIDSDKDTTLLKGIIKDIGGGGIRFLSDESLKEGDKIKCLIKLKDDYIIVLGKLLYKEKFPRSVYVYQYRIKFINIKQEDQEKIIRFIFEEQRRLARKLREVIH